MRVSDEDVSPAPDGQWRHEATAHCPTAQNPPQHAGSERNGGDITRASARASVSWGSGRRPMKVSRSVRRLWYGRPAVPVRSSTHRRRQRRRAPAGAVAARGDRPRPTAKGSLQQRWKRAPRTARRGTLRDGGDLNCFRGGRIARGGRRLTAYVVGSRGDDVNGIVVEECRHQGRRRRRRLAVTAATGSQRRWRHDDERRRRRARRR